MGAHFLPFLGCGGNHHRGDVFQGAGVRVRVEEAGGSDCKALSVEDGGFEVDEQPFWVAGKVMEGQAMNGELVLIGSGAEGEPGRGADREGLVKARRKGRKEWGIVCGGSSGVDP